MTTTPDEVSQLLRAWGEGDQTAFEKLMPLVYEDLRRMARRHMDRQSPGHTLQTTALTHEAYLRLVDQKEARCRIERTSSRWRRERCGRSWWITRAPVTRPNVAARPSWFRSMKPRWPQTSGRRNSSRLTTRSRVWRRLIVENVRWWN